LWVRLLSISASEARADVAEVYGAKKDYASTTKVEMAIIAASEAKADLAEVYASKRDYALVAEVAGISASEARADVAEVYASKEDDGEWKGKNPAVSVSNEDVLEVNASKESSASTAAANAEVAEAARDDEFKGKEPALSSYWGIAPSRLVNKDGVEWKWSCFKVSGAHCSPCVLSQGGASLSLSCATLFCAALGDVQAGHLHRSHQAPQAQGAARQARLLDCQIVALAY
jgi:hypothetical protein